jgi:Tol biopolymer transport system component
MLRLARAVLVMVGVMAAASGLAMAAGHVGLTSDDGLRIVFTSRLAQSTTGIFIMKLDGSAPQLLEEGHFAPNATCSPKDNRIAIVESNGNESSLVTLDTFRVQRRNVLTEDHAMIRFPGWSPDGERIVYELRPNSDEGKGLDSDIYIVDLNTENFTQLTDNHSQDMTPVWLPDSTNVAYLVSEDAVIDTTQLVSHNVSNGRIQTLSFGQNLYAPRWSPDGRHIAFVEDVSDGRIIVILDTQTSQFTRLSQTNYAELPSWSLRGDFLAFAMDWEDTYDIYVIQPDGRDLQRLTTSPMGESYPCWLYVQNFPEDN